ncbi:MAG TPA: M28 family peptidase, partial [Gemmatimonadaceae bacterium]|nr:M28 family peptidase [Gemmatimonadaceae bacterium]
WFFCVVAPLTSALAQPSGKVPAAMSAITESDLKRDLFHLAGDSMRGREAGTLDELRASVWIAEQLRKIGVSPAGPDGSYFQWWNMRRTRVSTVASAVRIGGRAFALWTEITPNGNGQVDVAAPTVWAGDGSDSTIDVRGKVAIVALAPPTTAVRETGTNSYEFRYAGAAITATSRRFLGRGAAALVLVADSIADIAFDGVAAIRARGAYDVEGGVPRFAPVPGGAAGGRGGRGAQGGAPAGSGASAPPAAPVFLVRRASLGALRAGGENAEIRIHPESFYSPSVNVVGVVKGTDPALRHEYVLFSSHQDHDGVRFPINGDSIWNGADDNGSVSVALLAIARAFVRQPGRRSVLFVYHGAEERGLLGSRYHAAHPVVPLANIVAVLNGDMIGRNNPDSASLLGIQPPHRNSSELVAMALRANALTGKFQLDSAWDRPTHPEGWYFRSDHLPYARLNVPAVEYSTNLHADYHTPRDEPSRIDYSKLTRMTKWMYLTGWFVASAPKRPAIDPGFQLER